MGKKNFVENYDPLRAHLTRDQARATAAAAAAEAPAALQVDEPELPIRELPRRSAAGGGVVAERTVTKPASRVAPAATPRRTPAPVPRDDASASVEVSPRVKVSQGAFQDLEAVLSNLHRATGSQVHYSIATRALWALLVAAEAQVLDELKKVNLGRLPSTRDKVVWAEYEDRVKQAFAQAFRKLPRSIFTSLVSQDADQGRELAAEG